MADGSIDQLNFEVILKDNEFNNKLQELQKLADAFNITMTQALTISKAKTTAKDLREMEKALKDAEKSQKGLNQAMEKMPSSKLKAFQENLRQTNNQLFNATGIMRTLSQLTGVAFGAMGIRRFLSTMIDVTGQFEVQKMALGAMLQDADKADQIFGEFRQLALESPYTFQEFTKFGKQLTAFNIPAEQLVDTTKMLADVAAGLGVDMQRIILAYGQIKSAGVLKGTELRQLTEAGVPILDELAKQIERTTGKTVQLAEVFDMISKKQIPFAMVEQAFRDMTSEGGKFYNMQEVLVETLAGKIGKLKDTWQQALYDIGSAQSGILKGSVDFLTNIIANYDKLGRVILSAAAAFGAYKAATVIATLAAQGYTIANQVEMLSILATEKAQKLLNATILKNPYVIAGAALVALTAIVIKHATAANELEKSLKILNKVNEDYNSSLIAEQEELRLLLVRMETLNPASEEYIKLKERLLGQYGQYLSEVDKENIAVGKLSGVYDTLALSIEKTAMARAKDEGMARLQDQFTETIKDITDTFGKKYGKTIKSSNERENLLDYIFGRIDASQLLDSVKHLVGTGGYYNPIEDLRNRFSEAKDAVEQGNKALEEAYGKTAEITKNGNMMLSPTEWQKKVGYRMGNSDDLWKRFGYKDNESWETYYTRIRGIYDKYENDIASAYDKEYRNKLKAERDELLKLNEDFNGALLAGSKSYKKEVRKQESEEEKLRKQKIENLKKDIEVVKKYKTTYDSFMGILGEEGAQEITKKVHKDANITDFNFTSQIIEMAEAIRALGDAASADNIIASLGLGEGKDLEAQLKKAQQTADAYKELIRTMTTEDTDIEGKGFWYDISKVASDLETKLNKLILQGQKAKEKLAGIDVNDNDQRKAIFNAFKAEGWSDQEIQQFWDKWVAGGRKSIDDFIKDASAKAEAAARERATDLAKEYVEEEYFIQGIDFDNLSDKTIGQIRKLKQKLNDILVNTEIKQSDRDILAAYGIDVNHLEDVNLDEFFDTLAKDRLIVFDEATQKTLKLMQAAQKAKVSWEDFGEAIKKIVQNRLKDLGDEEKKALAAFAKFAVDALSGVMDALGELAEASGKDNLLGIAEELKDFTGIVGDAIKGFQQGGWIGAVIAGVTSFATVMIKAATASAQLSAYLNEARSEARELQYQIALSKGVDSIFGTNTLKSVKNALDQIDDIKDSMTRRLSGMKGSIIKGWVLEPMAKRLGRELYDEFGNLNAETLKAILAVPESRKWKISSEGKVWLNEAIADSEAYAEALKQIDNAMEPLVGDIASSAADAIVKGWIEAGKAALDYADILDDVAQSYAKMVIKSMILDEEEGILNSDAVKQLTQAFVSGDADKAMSLIEGKLQAIADLEPVFQQVLETFDPYFKREEQERTASSKAIASNFSQDTIDYWSGQLTLLVEFARRGDEQRENMADLVLAIKENMGGASGDGNYASNVQTYLATIQGDTSAIRSDIYAMKLAIQNMNDKGVKML